MTVGNAGTPTRTPQRSGNRSGNGNGWTTRPSIPPSPNYAPTTVR